MKLTFQERLALQEAIQEAETRAIAIADQQFDSTAQPGVNFRPARLLIQTKICEIQAATFGLWLLLAPDAKSRQELEKERRANPTTRYASVHPMLRQPGQPGLPEARLVCDNNLGSSEPV